MYKSDAYVKDATSDTIFKDEKMLGLNYPLKEKYDVKFVPTNGAWEDGTTDSLIYKVYYTTKHEKNL